MNPNKTIHCKNNCFIMYYLETNKHIIKEYNSNVILETSIKQINKKHLNEEQNAILRKLTLGLKALSKEHKLEISLKEKAEIITTNSKVVKIINRMKEEKIDSLLISLFPKSKLIKNFINHEDTIEEVDMTLNELRISSYDVAERLIKENILPSNFLKEAA